MVWVGLCRDSFIGIGFWLGVSQESDFSDGQGQSQGEGEEVGCRLGEDQAGELPEMGQDHDGGDEHKALSCHSEEGGFSDLTDGLGQHIGHNDHSGQGEGDALAAEGEGPDFDHGGVGFLEQADDLTAPREDGDGENDEEDGGVFDAEEVGAFDSAIEMRAVIEAADGLEALPEADHRGGSEHYDARDDADGGDGGVPVPFCDGIEDDGGDAVQALSAEGGCTAVYDIFQIEPIGAVIAEVDLQTVAALDADI